MRAAKIFVKDLVELGVLEQVYTIKVTLYGSLALTGKGHHTPQAILLGLEGSDPETVDCDLIGPRYEVIQAEKRLTLDGAHEINFNIERDLIWCWDQVLKTHSNGMRFSVFDKEGDLLATNEYFSVGGGFVVNEKTKVDENLYYRSVDKNAVSQVRRELHSANEQEPTGDVSSERVFPHPFSTGDSLLALTKKHNMTIAQIVYDNELSFGYSDDDIHDKLMRIWKTMDDCIRVGVTTSATTLPGRLGVRRRAPGLYRRLMRGFYTGLTGPTSAPMIGAGAMPTSVIEGPQDGPNPDPKPEHPKRKPRAARVVGSFDHAILPMPPRATTIPAMDFLSAYAIAVNEVNAAGGRIVTSPTNGASGVIPAALKYIVEFISDDPERSIVTFLLTAAAVGMLFKRGSTISAAEGGCQAEVGVACSMAAAGFAACMGASPETVLQAAEIGIEHNLGLTCDPIEGLVQIPCIERNSLGAVKALTAAQLAMASNGVYSVSLDEAIAAMRLTSSEMSVKFKETSLSGLATTVQIPLTVPAC